jgi:hypothetical protein
VIDTADFHRSADEALQSHLHRLREETGEDAALRCRRLGVVYRAAGTTALVLDLDVPRCRAMLARAALARCYLLERVVADFPTAARFRKRSAPGFVDALAAQRPDLARRIAEHEEPWHARYEYEDDFLYHRFLHELALETKPDVTAATLEAMVRVRDGAPWPRGHVAEALQARESRAFDVAFLKLLDARGEEVSFQRHALGRDDLTFLTDERIFVEGLALVQLARSLGLSVRAEYSFCPAELLATAAPPNPNGLVPA